MDYERMLELLVNCEIDQIYHFAARSIVRNCIADPLGCFRTNILGTATLLEAARQSGRVQGIMCMESDKAYGAGPVPYREDQALEPAGIYEASKACVGHIARTYHRNYNMPVFTVRSANVYGPGDLNSSRLIPRTITRLLKGLPPQITAGAHGYRREFVFVDDVLACVTQLMDRCPWGEVFNVGSGETATVSDVIKWICDSLNEPYDADVWRKPSALLEIPDQRVSLTKLHKWLPAYRPMLLQEGLPRTIDWYRENGHG